jgi:ABC-type Fe3+/spermidine/putrescine transport system ATPase subunit
MPRVHVQLVHVVKKFGAVAAVDDVSLDVQEGSFTTLLGPSGCGKTTTLRLIAGFYEPDQGEIWIGGKRMNDVPPHKRPTAMVFQEYALFPHMTVFENVAYGLRMRRLPRKEIEERVGSILEFVGLPGLEGKFPHQLSGGQQQRVALARALVVEPEVLLLDEPLSNLDAKLRIRVRTEIREIQRRLKKTTIYVTHDQEEALSISDVIAVMDRGRIVQVGTPTEIYHRPANRFVADFVGLANFAQGTVVEAVDGRVTVDIGGSRLSITGEDASLRPGDQVVISVRPEAIRLSAHPSSAGENTLKGMITSTSFLGSVTRFWVRVGEMEWIVDVPGGDPEGAAGERYLFVPPENIRVVEKI